MDNIQLILYIVFLVGYFIFKIVTGKKKPVTREDPDQFDQHKEHEHEEYNPTEGPKTFEELLEELTGGKSKPVVRSEAPPKQEIRPELTQKEEDITVIPSDFDEEKKDRYERYNKDRPKYATLDEQIDLNNLDTSIGQVEEIGEVEEKTPAVNPYLAMFEDLESAKKAVVMSEILNRKY